MANDWLTRARESCAAAELASTHRELGALSGWPGAQSVVGAGAFLTVTNVPLVWMSSIPTQYVVGDATQLRTSLVEGDPTR